MKSKLNIGCGTDIRPDYINLDIVNLPGVDVVCDINQFSLPFEDNSFEYIVCNDVLEHVNLEKVLKDIHRVLIDGGIVEIRVPHFTSCNNFVDPTHIKMFSVKTFDFFTEEAPYGRGYYFDFHFKETIDSKITFLYKNPINWPFMLFVNINSTTKRIYEETFLRSLAPALNIEVKLKK
jgi:SAM-dependent methyltransferase